MPITYQTQFIWGYLKMLSNLIENINLEMQEKDVNTLNDELKDIINSLIKKVQILDYDNSMFVHLLKMNMKRYSSF